MKRIDVSFKYEIYHTGKIVELGDIDKAKDVAFIYIDKRGNNHDLGSYKLFEIDAYANGIKKSQMKASALLSEYTGIVSSKYGMVYYKKLGYKVKVLNYMEHANKAVGINYNKEGVLIKFSSFSDRKYLQPKCFAAWLGALADTGFEDIRLNGFTSKDGTGSPSLTHPKGIYFDLGILNKNKTVKPLKIQDSLLDVERNNALLDALYKFGYKDIISNYYKGTKLLNHCRRDNSGIHDNHFHLQDFKPQID